MTEAEKLAWETLSEVVCATYQCAEMGMNRDEMIDALIYERVGPVTAAIQSALDAERARTLEEAAGVCERRETEYRDESVLHNSAFATVAEAALAAVGKRIRALAKEPRP